MKINILAFAAHPDDAELSCSGTLKLHKNLGYTTGIIDLTQGELGTKGSVEIRYQESDASAKILDLDLRKNLKFRDGFFKNDEQHQIEIIKNIRAYCPDIVLINAPKDRHPDHARAAELCRDACFLSGLVKIETEIEYQKQKAWRPKKVLHYIQDFELTPDFYIDISSTISYKMDSIAAYKSQFEKDENNKENNTYISSKEFVDGIYNRARNYGKRIGTSFAEGFIVSNAHLGLQSFQHIILPEIA